MIKINRNASHGQYLIADIFPDIKQNRAVREIFDTPEELDEVLRQTRVLISDQPSYMRVDNDDGSILIGRHHLEHADRVILHLDIIHELVHVRQHRRGLDLYDRSRAYVDRPTEIEAYALTVKEARRIGLSDHQILNYLSVEWVTPQEHDRLAKRLGIG